MRRITKNAKILKRNSLVFVEALTSSQKFTLRSRHGFDHILPITTVEEKLSTFRV